MKDTISFRDLLNVIKKRILMILSMIMIAAVTSGVISYYILTPKYEASTEILIHQSSAAEILDVNQLRTSVELINTYNDIIKSPLVLNQVIAELKLNRDFAELNEQVIVSSSEKSQVVKIIVQDPDFQTAILIANKAVEIFKQEMRNIMNFDNVTTLSKAEENANPYPVKPDPILNIIIASALGLAIGIGLAFMMEYLDHSIKNEDDVEEYLGVPVIGNISQFVPLKSSNLNPKERTALKRKEVGGETLGS